MLGQYITLTYVVADRATTVLGRITHAHNGVIQAQRTLLSAATATTLGFLGMSRAGVGALHVIKRNFIDLNAQADETRLGIAGMLRALGYSNDMNAAQRQSKTLYDQLVKLSGPLPGEADAYINAFQLSIGALSQTFDQFQKKYGNKGLFGGTSGFEREMNAAQDQLTKMATFSSYWQATAVSSQVGEAQAARDLPRLLGGHVTAQTRTWQKMMPQIMAASGGRVSDTKSFNALGDADRFKLMVDVIKGMAGAVDLAADKQSSLNGSIKTTIDMWKRLASEGTYVTYLKYLKQFDHYLRDSKNTLNYLAQTIDVKLNAALERSVRHIKSGWGWFLSNRERLLSQFDELHRRSKQFYAGAASNANDARHVWSGHLGSGVGHIPSAMIGFALARAARFGGSTAQIVNAGYGFGGLAGYGAGAAAGTAGLGASMIPAMLRGGNPFSGIGGAAIAGSRIGGFLGAGAGRFLSKGLGLGAGAMVFGGLKAAAEDVTIVFFRLLAAVGDIITPINKLLEPLEGLGFAFGKIVTNILPPLIEVFTALVGAGIGMLAGDFKSMKESVSETALGLKWFGNGLHSFAEFIRGGPSRWAQGWNPADDVAHAASSSYFDTLEWNKRYGLYSSSTAEDMYGMSTIEDTKSIAELESSGTRKERPTVYNDFRGSRFDITQKFAEGFDPDRIAVSFMDELQSAADRRLDSANATTGTR